MAGNHSHADGHDASARRAFGGSGDVRAPDALQQRKELELKARERFYEEVDDSSKAEFINGEVIMHSPAIDWHNFAQGKLFKLLGTFADVHGIGQVRMGKALCEFPRNSYEPDVVFFGAAKSALITRETKIYPIPDFICEVLSPTTKRRDRGVKFQDYEAHGVTEYWIYDPKPKILEQYVVRAGKYEQRLKSAKGTVASVAVPGFKMPIEAMSDADVCLDALSAILARR